MRVTLLGHASVLVEMAGRNVIMDPVFSDPFEEGAVVSCPKRRVRVEKLPRIDTIVLSHGHLDHFDIPSLARLPRTADVVFPKDHTIGYALSQLGFKQLRPLDPMVRLQGPGFEIMTSRSSVTNVIEFGVLFKDQTGVFWNQVDSVLSKETIDETLKTVGPIDLHFAMHASQNFGFFASRSTGFPHEMHKMNLNCVLRVRARMTVPGAAGFRFTGPIEWCNAFLFPMSREQFVEDLAKLDPSLATQIANPGDVFEITGGKVRHFAKSSRFAETVEDDTRLLRFDPTAAIPPLADPNPEGLTVEQLARGVEEILDGLWSYVCAVYAGGGDEVVFAYRKSGVRHGVGVVFPGGEEKRWRFDFRGAEPQRHRDDAAACEIVHRIAASALVAWGAHAKSYFYLRAFSRRFTTLYTLARTGEDASLEPKEAQDLLDYYMLRKAPRAELAVKERLDRELAPFIHGETEKKKT